MLALLRKKDTKIRELGEVLSTRRNTGGVHGRSAKGEGQSKRGGRAGRSCADASGNGCFGTGRPSDAGDTSVDAALDVATGLERRVREQEDQIEALLEEVKGLCLPWEETEARVDTRSAVWLRTPWTSLCVYTKWVTLMCLWWNKNTLNHPPR